LGALLSALLGAALGGLLRAALLCSCHKCASPFVGFLVCTQDRVLSPCLCTTPNTTQDIVVYSCVADSCQRFFSSWFASFFAVLAISTRLDPVAILKTSNFRLRLASPVPDGAEGRKIRAKSLLTHSPHDRLSEPFI